MSARKLLVPLDATDFSRSALRTLTKLFQPENCKVTLLHVGPVPEVFSAEPARPVVTHGWTKLIHESSHTANLSRHPMYAVEIWESARTELRERLRPEKEQLEQEGYRVEVAVRFGEPAHEICEFVEEYEFDAVIMATHGRTGIRRALSGSVAQKVLRQLSIPVVMLRPTQVPSGREARVGAGLFEKVEG